MARISLLFSLILLSLQSLADETPYYSDEQYNRAEFGHYVTQTFLSHPEVTSVPVVNFMKPFSACDDGSYLFIAPRGNEAESTPMILDANGSPVWASTTKYGQVYNLQVQKYRDQHYLTFWGGNDAVGGHGVGEYFMLDQHYEERYRIKAANGLGADLHAFTITTEDTALITVYEPVIVDVSSEMPRTGDTWIWEAIFQELDIETGDALFEWRASAHIPVTNSYIDVRTATEYDPWDVYHINSVEKDERGNYLVSFRHLRAIVYIDGTSGAVLWQLGGKANSFTDLSDGQATTFLGQHDAHWADGHRGITLFDNRADWEHRLADTSQGLRIAVDLHNMTARAAATFADPFFPILSASQGSYQTLPNGHVLLGYGFNGVVAEFAADGTLLCDAYFQPAATFSSGDVQSYRNLKFNWTGFPLDAPRLAVSAAPAGAALHVSWNGATEVAAWLLLGFSAVSAADAATTALVPREGFETVVDLSALRLARFVRAIAVDDAGVALGTSNVVDIGDAAAAAPLLQVDLQDDEDEDAESAPLLLIFGLMIGVAATLVALVAVRIGRPDLLARRDSADEEATPSGHGFIGRCRAFWRAGTGATDDDPWGEEGLLARYEMAQRWGESASSLSLDRAEPH